MDAPSPPLHKSKARAWAWSARTEPTMKLVLLAVARIGGVDRAELMRLTGLTEHSLDRTLAKLRKSHHLESLEEVLRG